MNHERTEPAAGAEEEACPSASTKTAVMCEVGRLDPPAAGLVPVSVDVGPAGELVVLWSTPAGLDAMTSRQTTASGTTFADTRAVMSEPMYASVHTDVGVAATRLQAPTVAFPMIQPLPGGGFLLVGARCRWTAAAGAEHNALVYDADGRIVHTGTLGDGIEHVKVSASGRIWVGYFDEGVYGNFGWGGGRNGSPPPIGAPGIVAFASDLRPTWLYPYDGDYDAISDAYAINLVGETLWSCCYSDFPVVRIDGDQITGWTNDIGGARHLLLADDRAALIGGYGKDRWRVAVGTLGAATFDVADRRRLVMPGGSPPTRGTAMVSAGATLHAVADGIRYRLDFADLA